MARFFDGVDDVVEATSGVVQDVPVSLSIWFNPQSLPGGSAGMVGIASNANENAFAITLRPSGAIRARISNDIGFAESATTTATAPIGTWTHAGAVFASSSSIAVYLRGGNKVTDADTLAINSALNRTILGATREAGTLLDFYNGRLAEYAIWNVALDDKDMQRLAAGVPPREVRGESLREYLPLHGRTGWEISEKGRIYVPTGTRGTVDDPPQLHRIPSKRFHSFSPPAGGASHTLVASAGSFTLTGTAATLIKGPRMVASAGSFSLTGTAAGLRAARLMPASAGSYTLTGSDVEFGRSVPAVSGSYVLTGSNVGLLKQWKLVASSGSFAMTGTAASFYKGRTMAGAAGSYALTGSDASLKWAQIVGASAGSFALTGTAAGLLKQWKLVAGAGSFALTGSDVGLQHDTPGNTTLDAQAGVFALTGTAAALRQARRMTASAGSYALTGTAAAFSLAHRLTADAGSYALSGSNVVFPRTWRLTSASGSYVLTGSNVALTVSGSGAILTLPLSFNINTGQTSFTVNEGKTSFHI